jgi:glucosylceramidase
MTTARVSITGFALLFLAASCSSSGGNSSGTGGSSSGTGGTSSTGGSTGTGGDSSSGGQTGAGGTSNTGGTPGQGGSTGSGGSPGSGGVLGTGGNNPGTGGNNPGTGGNSPGTGGSNPGTGGSAPAQMAVVTSGSGAYWKTDGTLSTSTGNATVTVNDSSAQQTWEGFGGAFNEIGWNELKMLSQSDQDKAIQLLYGTDGAHFAMGRIPMGASDYALTRYTEDETSGDTSLTNFSITRDTMYLVPYVKAATAVNSGIRFWSSPWTPPTWMKTTSGSVNGTSCALVGQTMYDGGCMNASTANLTAYAQYFVKFVAAYKDQGINIDMVAPQNEPNYAQGYPSCLWNSSDYTKFVGQYLGPALTSAGNGTKVMLGTNSNGDSGKDSSVVSTAWGDSTAKSYFKALGLQWGMLDNFEGSSNSTYKGYGISIWATEHNDQAYGVESWGYVDKAIKAGVTSYSAWNMVTDGVGKGNDTTRQWAQDSLLTVKPSTCNGTWIDQGQLCATPAYYVFRHCSQFVQVGAKVLSTSGGDALAFKNPDGSEVAVMYNSGSASSSYTVSIAGKKLSFSMPAQGWATVFVPGN